MQNQIPQNQTKLIIELKFLNEYYINQETGYNPTKDGERGLLGQLVDLGLVFRTPGGYFISTMGQDYLANLSE
jgi:hypothetical protein